MPSRTSGRGWWLAAVVACAWPIHAQDSADPRPRSAATRELRAYEATVTRRIVQVTQRVFVAVGYTLSSNGLIVGDDGVIIVDPGHAIPFSQTVREAFAALTDKPVKAIIYTHGHPDHTGGAGAFITAGADIQVWARANFNSEINALRTAGIPLEARPADSQGGDLPLEKRFSFYGPVEPMRPNAGGGQNQPGVPPNRTFDTQRTSLTIAGVRLDLVAAPGETADQLYLWLPDEGAMFTGDNVFDTWPNVYPLRGVNRSIRDWADSIDRMIRDAPRYLVQGHGNPILEGAVESLTNRRDAMRWVYARTLEGAGRSMTPDELVEYVRLPEPYASLPYLRDYYGNVEATVRQIYAQSFGWFDGDPLNLFRESPRKQAERAAALVGGPAALLDRARQAVAQGDFLGAAQLAQHAPRLAPAAAAPKLLLADALERLAEQSISITTRHYSASYANRLRAEAAERRE